MKIALVDDDPRALAQLEQYLTEQLGRETEISRYGSGEALLADWAARRLRAGGAGYLHGGATGMEVARAAAAGDGQVRLAFATSSNDFASESYEVGAATICESPSGRRESGPCWSGWIWRRWSAPAGCGCGRRQVVLRSIRYAASDGHRVTRTARMGTVPCGPPLPPWSRCCAPIRASAASAGAWW